MICMQDTLCSNIKRIKRTILKTLKENNNKVTKDVLLHQIFQEISEENKEIGDDGYLDEIIPIPKTKLSKIREIQKKRQWVFIALLVLSIIYVLFNTESQSTPDEEQMSNTDLYAIPKANQIEKQEAESEPLDVVKEETHNQNIIKKTNPIQVIEKSSVAENSIKEKKVEIQTAISPKEPLTEREKAKESLFLQMQN